ncbi:MAG TPA: hypothetical protein EYO94_05965 [Acidobacteria bacterium]|nr:hypothetical protein [Acidobacteriota bacterium]
MNVIPSHSASLVSNETRRALLGFGVIGTLAFVYGVIFGENLRAWQSLLVNFLFFAGLAQSGVVISALLQVTSARWGRSLKRTAEATAAFFPVAFILLLVLLGGITSWAPWVHEPIEAKTPWLNIPFFVVRQLLAFGLLTGLSLLYVYKSLRPDIGMLHESGSQSADGFAKRLITNWKGTDAERETGQRAQDRLAVAVLISYAWVFTLVSFDFVMSLDPHWFSTLMGGYYFIGNLFVGFAFLAIIATWGRHRLAIADYVGKQQLHDVGKLLFGFSILWAYLLFSQYLVIWYGDLAEETEFIYHRMHGAWAPITWTMFGLCFVIPFISLLSKAIKMKSNGLLTIACIAFVGMWLERFILVAPSLWHEDGVPLGILELLITLGVFGLFVFCYTGFLRTFPILPISDPKFISTPETGH